MKLYVGGEGARVQGEPMQLAGNRCFTAAQRLRAVQPLDGITALLDSGAFSDPPLRRRTPEEAFQRQLTWEQAARRICKCPTWQAEAVVSYDRLIDETWSGNERHKQRWTLKAADVAVEETVAAARYLASQREALSPRRLVLACQGVDAMQYRDCVAEVLSVAQPHDWIGYGGWCILGRFTTWLPEFWRTLYLTLPMVAAAGIKRVHLFGVLYAPALGGMLWIADQLGLEVSTDSSRPILDCTRGNHLKSGARATYWRDSVDWWVSFIAGLRETAYYREPPDWKPCRQLELF
jgi:hypothetical protein